MSGEPQPAEQSSAGDLTRTSWMAWLFIIGSACFAIGPVLTVADGSAILISAIFFVGSIFFTSASSIQLLLARETLHPGTTLHRLLEFRNPAWSSAAIQWIGTLAFNVTTFRSLVDALGTRDIPANAVGCRTQSAQSFFSFQVPSPACLRCGVIVTAMRGTDRGSSSC